MNKFIYSLLILSVCFAVSNAEYFYLKSGEVINGKIISEKDDSVTVSVAGTGAKKKIMLLDIDEITKTPKAAPVASHKEISSADDAKTQFTSEFKQDKAEGETYIKDNESGVLVFNVRETVVEKPKQPESRPENNEDDFDAALFLLGGDNNKTADNSATSASAAESGSIKTETSKSPAGAKEYKSGKNKKSPQKNEADEEDFDAALFLLEKEARNEKALVKKEESSDIIQPKNEEYYDPAMFLIDDQDEPVSAYNAQAVQKKSAGSYYSRPDNETFLAVAFDLKGVHVFSGDVQEGGVKSSADRTENSDYGISLSAEQYGYVSRFAALGLGIGFQFKRALEESPGRFGFLPLYGAFKMRFVSEENYHFYAVAHLGYNFLLANSKYLDKSDADGGLYYAAGLGASYNSYVFQVLYSVSNASINYSNSYAGDKVDKDIMHSKVGFYIGYLL